MKKNFEYIGNDYLKYMKTDYRERLKRMEECIDKNHRFLCDSVHDQQFLFNFKTKVLSYYSVYV